MSQAGLSQPQTSIAIVGGGIIGLSIAWRLGSSGWQVTVFDKGPLGAEASWAGAGMLSPGGEFDDTSPLASLALESRHSYSEFVREIGKASGLVIDYQECGALDLAYSREEFEGLELRAAHQAAAGISSKPVPLTRVATFWPRVRVDGLAAARFYPQDAIVNSREVIAALELACRRRSVAFLPHSPVTHIHVAGDIATVEAAGLARPHRAVVVAAGAWSGDIAVSGVPPLPASQPAKGHLLGYQQPGHTCHTIVRRGHTYMLQRANGLLIVGTSVEHVGFDRAIRPSIVADLAAQASFLFPHLAETTPSEVWIGFRPASDGLQIGAWRSPLLYLAYGHYRNGILLAPATAQRLTAEINANLRMR